MTVALVTGGGAGIGAACARRLARDGITVAVADINPEAAHAVADEIGGLAIAADVSSSAAVNAMVEAVMSAHGRLDIAVNNAGIGGAQLGVADLTDEQWAETRGVNLDGVFYCMRAELAVMRAQHSGVIVNMASILSVVGWPNAAPYTAAKHGVLGLTRSAAIDYAAEGIRVNAVGPGFISTELVLGGLPADVLAQLASLHPIGRMGRPEEVADLVAFLASDAATNITGSYFPIDGGYTTR